VVVVVARPLLLEGLAAGAEMLRLEPWGQQDKAIQAATAAFCRAAAAAEVTQMEKRQQPEWGVTGARAFPL